MNKKVVADTRWIGVHGIGRFANEILKRIPHEPLRSKTSFTSPLDVVKTSLALRLYHRDSTHFFTPGYNPIIFCKQKFSITLHDLIHLDVAQESSILKKLYYNYIVLPAIKRAENIFTVSNYSKKRILEWSGVDVNRVTVVGNGVDSKFFENNKGKRLEVPYYLYIGNQKYHKNVDFMLASFAFSERSIDSLLVVSGKLTDVNRKLAFELNILDRIIEAGNIPEDELAHWYRGAVALIMPSLYEGFGLPVAEAMASRTLVICSDRTALPEVAGDAAIYFDGKDKESLIEILNRDMEAKMVEDLIEKGYARAKMYSWDNVAANILKKL